MVLKIPSLSWPIVLAFSIDAAPWTVPQLEPTSQSVRVRNVSELVAAIANAKKHQTILIADGTYELASVEPLRIRTDSVTLYGESRDPSKVIFRGQGFTSANVDEEMLKIEATATTLAYFTLRDVRANALKIQTGGNHGLLVHNLHFIDICERSIKGPDMPVSKGGEVRYCLFEQKTPITTAIPNLHADGDYIAGMDMMKIEDWNIHHNEFRNIRGRTGGGRAGVFLWKGCKNVTVEANLFSGCDRGIAFGNPGSTESDMVGGVIRNNFIVAGVDIAIEICNATQTLIAHNSVYSANPAFNRTLSFYANGAGNRLVNNLVMGKLAVLNGTAPDTSGNMLVTTVDAAKTWFRNPAVDDLHLQAGAPAVNRGKAVSQVSLDFDGESRDVNPDIGADEWAPSDAIRPKDKPRREKEGAMRMPRSHEPTAWSTPWQGRHFLAQGTFVLRSNPKTD